MMPAKKSASQEFIEELMMLNKKSASQEIADLIAKYIKEGKPITRVPVKADDMIKRDREKGKDLHNPLPQWKVKKKL